MPNIDCVDCENKAKAKATFILWDNAQYQFKPLCSKHLHDYIHLEGEINLTFIMIDDVPSLIKEANQQFKWFSERYSTLLKEYRKLKKKEEP